MIAINLKEFHRVVCERDKYICQLQTSPECKHDYSDDYYFANGVNQYVCGDHLLTQGGSPELRLDTSNGKCVCKSCHTLRHKGQVPEGYIEQVIESSPVAIADCGYRMMTGLELPVNCDSSNPVECKKCKKYLTHAKGLCLQCQPFSGHQLKLKKEKKSKK